MADKLLVIIPGITLLLFFLNIFLKGNTVQSCLLFILMFLPLMDLKITKEAWGGFKVFDAISFFALIFLLKDFLAINLNARNNFYFLLFVILSLIILIGGLASEFPDKTYLYWFKTLPIFIFARFFMTECVKDSGFHLKAIKTLKIAYISSLIFLGFQILLGLGFTFYPGLAPNTMDPIYHVVRYPGVFYDSQAHGQFLAMGSFLFLYNAPGSSKQTKIFNYVLFAIMVIAINLAGSRAAFGGFLIGMLFTFLFNGGKYRLPVISAVLAGYVIFKGISINSSIFERSETLSEDLQFRQGIWNDAYKIIQKNPYLGIGIGNYQEYIIQYDQDQYLEVEDGQLVYFDQPESGYLKIMVELGFTGFAIFALFIIASVYKGLLSYFKNQVSINIVFLISALLCFLVAFTTVYSIYDYRLLIMFVGLIVLIVTHPKLENTNQYVG